MGDIAQQINVQNRNDQEEQNRIYQEKIQKQFKIKFDEMDNDDQFRKKIQQISKDFDDSIKNLKSQKYVFTKTGSKLKFMTKKREIQINQDNFLQQVDSNKIYGKLSIYDDEIPKNLKLSGYDYFLPLQCDEKLIVIQFKNNYEKELMEKFVIMNNLNVNIVQDIFRSKSNNFKNNDLIYDFKINLDLMKQNRLKGIKNQLKTQELFNNFDRLLCLKMTQNVSKVVQISQNDKDYIDLQKQQELTQQDKKNSFFNNKMSFAMNQNIRQNISVMQDQIKFILNYIDCQEYNKISTNQKIQDAKLEIVLQQSQQNDRQIDGQTVNEQDYFRKTIKLNPSEKRLNLQLNLVNNKIVQQSLNLEQYDEQDNIKISILGENIQFSNQYPLYLFLDKFNIGQKFHIYIADGLYLNFETLYTQDKNIDSIYQQKIQKNEDLIESIYCDEFYKLPIQYTQFMQIFFQQLNEDQEDQKQNSILDKSKYSQKQLIELKNQKDYEQILLNIYDYQLKQISKNWIVKKELVKQIENFVQKLLENDKNNKIINLKNFYQDIHYYFDVMKNDNLYNDQILLLANQMLVSGLTMNMRIEFYRKYGQVAELQKIFIQQVKQKYEQDIKVEDLYQFIRSKINFNCQLQQILRDDISKFKSNIGNQYKLWAYFALQAWVSVIQQYIFKNLRLKYGKYIIQYAFKLLQIIINHDFYKQCPNISEELIFWLILSQSIHINFDFQEEVIQQQVDDSKERKQSISMMDIQNHGAQLNQKLKLNVKIINGLIFLRYSIRTYYPNINALIEKYKINVEMLFCDSLQQLCFDLLNSNIYYRVLDIAYGLIMEGLGFLHFAIILGIMHFFEEQIQFVNSYQSFIDILKFSAQNIYQETEFVNLILHYRIDLDQDYNDFGYLINQKNVFYDQQNQKFIAFESLLQDEQILNLAHIKQIIENLDIQEDQVSLVKHDSILQKPWQIFIYVQNLSHLNPQLKINNELKSLEKGFLQLNFQNELEFVVDDKVILKINCNALPLNTLIQQNTITNINFNIIISSDKISINTIQELNLNIPQQYFDEFLNYQQTFTIKNQQILDEIQKVQKCNAQYLFVDSLQWKQDSLMSQIEFTKILQNSEIFKNNKELDKFCSNYDKLYLKDFLLYLILNCNGTLKQKLMVIYDTFKCLNNDTFNMEIMQNILIQIFEICKIPILKQEQFNLMSYIQYKNVNNIKEARVEKGDKYVDITEISNLQIIKVQKYIDFYYLKYGTQSIILNDLNQIISEYKEIENSFDDGQQQIQKKINMSNFLESSLYNGQDNKETFNIKNDEQFMESQKSSIIEKINELKEYSNKPLILKIDYNQNFQNRCVKYNLDENLQIQTDGHNYIQNQNILNMNFSYQEIEFKEFFKICNDFQILNNTIVQDQNSQNQLIECKFQIFVNDQELIKMNYQQQQFDDIVMFDVSEYEDNLLKLNKIDDKSQNSITQLIQTDKLDILLPLKHLQKQISNILLKSNQEKPISNLNNINFMQNAKIILLNEITPSGIMDLSLFDIQQITKKGLEIKITYDSLDGKQLTLNNEINTRAKYQF